MGRNAINAFRLGMQTVGHNISNMNTEGYSRQRAVFSTAVPEDIPNIGQLGQGMNITAIERIRDEFLDFQFRDEQATLGYWTKINDLYDSIQNYISEPASSGIRAAMDTFFTNMQTLQQTPEDTSARQALVTSANSLGLMLGNLISNFNNYNESINLELKQAVDEANSMLHDMAHINLKIANAEALGQNANDLYDQRDLLIDKLSQMMDISYNEPLERDGIKGEFFLSVNGKVLVQGTKVRELAAHAFMWDNQVYYDVQVTDNEFNIVSNIDVADALATGPEGTYQLIVDRIANGVEWTTGGGNAHCLDTFAVKASKLENTIVAGGQDNLMTFKATTSAIPGGILLNSSSEDTNSVAITVTDANGNNLENLRIYISRVKDADDNDIWRLSDGTNTFYTDYSTNGSNLTSSDFVNFINTYSTNLSAAVNTNRTIDFTPNSSGQSVKVVCSNGILGTITEEKGPGVSGTFDIWVGSQGNKTTSNTFTGGTLPAGTGTFRIALSGADMTGEMDITIGAGTLSSNLGSTQSVSNPPTVDEFTAFLNTTFKSAVIGDSMKDLKAAASDSDSDGINDTFTITAGDEGIISIVDIDDSGTAGAIFPSTTTTKHTITVTETDTIEDISSMINVLSSPLSASTSKGYLTISTDSSNVMTFGGDTDLMARLGLVHTETLSGNTRTVSNINERGIILSSDSEDIPYKLQFRSIDEDNYPTILTVKIDKVSGGWKLRAELDGEEMKDSDGNDVFLSRIVNTAELLTADLEKFVNEAVEIANGLNPQITGIVLDSKTLNLNTRDDEGILNFYTDSKKSLEVTDYSGMLGVLTEAKQELTGVNMRAEPENLDDALNISGSFRIQVGTQGTRVTSSNFKANPGKGLGEGEILSAGEAGETYTFRVGVSGDQADFTASWNNSLKKWVLSSDLGTEARVIDSENKTGDHVLTVKDLTEFMTDTFINAGNADNPALAKMSVTTGKSSLGTLTQFYIESGDNHLISISDVTGDLASRLGIVNDNPVITIDVESSDSLITIRNKINEKYQEEFGLTEPEQWVHASVDNGYLEISANVAGEAQRITLMGSTDGNMQVLRRLGLTANQRIQTDMKDEDGNILYSYREVAYIPDTGLANDASFSLNNIRYLSSDNKFSQARRIPAATGTANERYSAKTLSDVGEGMWLNLKSAGATAITVRHHITDGSMKALEEIRDGIIPGLKDSLDNMAYSLAKHVNAYQYSGYGTAGDVTTTGVAFFNALGTKADAAQRLSVTDKVIADPSLIGAAMGKKDSDGKAVSGVSGGNGDGTNASRMVGLNFSKVLENHTLTIGGVYDGMLSQIGSEAASAKLMYTTQATVSAQIDSQRQACSGVNLDEELMDMIILNRAFGAMARYVNTYDEMLDKIINGFGLAGR